MNHRDTKESVLIRTGLYSSTIYEMEIWTLANELDYTDEEYEEQLKRSGWMSCGLRRESVGLFTTKERALDHLDMMYEDSFAEDRELYCAFIRERAICCMMQSYEYIKEWTYVNRLLVDESIVRNFAEEENYFLGRPKEMIRFKRGDIVMIPDTDNGHWGIVWGTPVTPENVQEMNKRLERKYGDIGLEMLGLGWDDDQYTILTNSDDYMVSHEHILAHHVLSSYKGTPEYVREVLEKALDKCIKEESI